VRVGIFEPGEADRAHRGKRALARLAPLCRAMRNGSSTLPVTVLHGIRVGSWNTKPMRPGAWSRSRRQVPALGGVRPATMRNSVLLPQPEGPRRLRNSPRA
jgi:hypothetical protein